MIILAFLGNRSQSVVVDGEESDSVPVCSGVPKGPVLGPTLFLIYINDLPDTITPKVRLFADDTAFYLTIEGENDSATLKMTLKNCLCGSGIGTWSSTPRSAR